MPELEHAEAAPSRPNRGGGCEVRVAGPGDCSFDDVAYAVLLSNPGGKPMPLGEDKQPWTYFDYAYAMIQRMAMVTRVRILVLVTPDVTSGQRRSLELLASNVVTQDVPHVEVLGTKVKDMRWKVTGSKLQVFNLTQYRKILMMDSDTFMIHNADHVFCTPGDFSADTEFDSVSFHSDLYSSVFLAVPREQTFNELMGDAMKDGQAQSDQDLLASRFLGHMTCMAPEFNCRIFHRSRRLCHGWNTESQLLANTRIVHTKLGEDMVTRLLPLLSEQWLDYLPPWTLLNHMLGHEAPNSGSSANQTSAPGSWRKRKQRQ